MGPFTTLRAWGATRPGAMVRTISLAVVFVAALLVVPAIWIERQITDEDRFVQMLGPAASQPAIQDAVTRIATGLAVDAILASTAAPDDSSLRSTTQVLMVTAGAEAATRQVVGSPAFRRAWEEAVRSGHAVVVALLTGHETAWLRVGNGQVTLDLSPVMAEVDTTLRGWGIEAPIPRDQVAWVVIDSTTLGTLQTAFRLIDLLRLPLFLLGIAASAIVVITSRNWSTGAASVALAVTAAMVVLMIIIGIERWLTRTELRASVDAPAALAFHDLVVGPLVTFVRSVGLIALGATLAFSVLAGRIREGGAIAGSAWRQWPALIRAERAIAAHRRQATAITLVVLAAVLLIADPPSLQQLLLLGLVAGVALVAIARAEASPIGLTASGSSAAEPAGQASAR